MLSISKNENIDKKKKHEPQAHNKLKYQSGVENNSILNVTGNLQNICLSLLSSGLMDGMVMHL